LFAFMLTRFLSILVAGLTLAQAAAAELPWHTDLAKAQAAAKAEKKLVLLDFTGSNWCPPCKMMDRDIFRAPEFAAYAQKNLVLVKADFPRPNNLPKEQREANQKLSDRFNIEGFPTLILLDGAGQELGRTVGYDGQGIQSFLKNLEKRFKS
jgi:thiol-disulfide isomerase/thioredoxin